MAQKFVKSVLRVGETMQSPDGPVPVTAERLTNFHQQHKRLLAANYGVPSRWEHAVETADLLPLSADELTKKLDGRHAVGKMIGFDYTPGAEQAELTLEVTDSRAAEQCDSNRVKVSPVIAAWWKDGHGNEYTDFISHADLVERPVDHTQGDFKRVPETIACSLEKWIDAKTVRLAFPPDDKGEEKPSEESNAPANPPAAEPPVNPDSPPKATDKTKVAAVVEGFKSLGVVLPSDFDLQGDNAVDLLLTGLNTLIAAKVKAEEENQQAEEEEKPATVASPGYATMSTEQKATVEYVERMHRKQVSDRLDSLLKDGRCTPDECRTRKDSIGTVRLSLDAEQKPITSELEKWIESREPLPKGTFWTPEQRTRLSTEPSEAAPPDGMGGEPTDKEYAERAISQLKRHGYVR